jgi:Fe-S-cluster containining protein
VNDARRFRCTGCGECCRNLRVAVTDRDLERLAGASGVPPQELVDWLQPDAVDMSGEPESFVELSQGRRLMALAHGRFGCALLDAQGRCRVYAARPADCRLFPFDVTRDGARAKLGLLPLVGCDAAWDGNNETAVVEADDGRRWRELERYQELVRRWNRRAAHRRRLGRPAGGSREFLAFLGLFAAEGEPPASARVEQPDELC